MKPKGVELKFSIRFILILSFLIYLNSLQELKAQYQTGDIFVGVSNGQIQWYRNDGTFVQTLNTGLGGYTTGMAIDAGGILYVTNFSGNSISMFDQYGVLIGLFPGGTYSTPESIVFDAASNVYVGCLGTGIEMTDHSGNNRTNLYSSRVDFMDLKGGSPQCIMLRDFEGTNIETQDICSILPGPTYASGLGGTAYALRIIPVGPFTGQVLLANGVNILRLDPPNPPVVYDVSGHDGWFALNLDPDGDHFWSADFNTSNVYKFNIQSGITSTNFNTGTGITTVFGLCLKGELTSATSDTNCISIIRDTTYCDSTGTYIYEFQIHNNSPTKSIEQLEITVDSPQPPNYVVTIPSILNFSTPVPPLGNSGVQKVKLIGPGAVAYAEVCYTLSAHFVNDDCPWCCYIENCIKLPICSCADVIHDSIYCEDGDYFYNFTLKNGTQYDVTKIQITSPGTLPITFIPQIIHFGTPILPGQVFPNLTARMLGAAAGLTIPVKIKLFSDDFECCYLEFDQLIPECDTTYCDTATVCVRTLCPDEQLTVCLARSVIPYDILFTATAVPDANGCARYEFPGAVMDESYYLVVISLNSLETWSATPQVVNGLNCLEYDFTADSSQAYGNNMMNINGVWYLLSGDVNQDGFIDMTDLLAVYNGASVFGTGVTDLNCDGITDLNDILIVQKNYLNFAQIMRPY